MGNGSEAIPLLLFISLNRGTVTRARSVFKQLWAWHLVLFYALCLGGVEIGMSQPSWGALSDVNPMHAFYGVGDQRGSSPEDRKYIPYIEFTSRDASTDLEALDLFYSVLWKEGQPKNLPQDSLRPKGIRYSFIQETMNGEDEWSNAEKLSRDWRGIRLSIEPNHSGALYVLAQTAMEKWQQLEGVARVKKGEKFDGVHVNAFQTVEFRMGNVTNRLGRLIVPSVFVILSPDLIERPQDILEKAPLMNVQTEQTDHSMYVVKPSAVLNAPFIWKITFEK